MANQSNQDDQVILPEEFPFPYEKPYDIQLNFMKSLYKTLELKKVGIFESPTGTVRTNAFKHFLNTHEAIVFSRVKV